VVPLIISWHISFLISTPKLVFSSCKIVLYNVLGGVGERVGCLRYPTIGYVIREQDVAELGPLYGI